MFKYEFMLDNLELDIIYISLYLIPLTIAARATTSIIKLYARYMHTYTWPAGQRCSNTHVYV